MIFSVLYTFYFIFFDHTLTTSTLTTHPRSLGETVPGSLDFALRPLTTHPRSLGETYLSQLIKKPIVKTPITRTLSILISQDLLVIRIVVVSCLKSFSFTLARTVRFFYVRRRFARYVEKKGSAATYTNMARVQADKTVG